MKLKHPAMNIELVRSQTWPEISANAFMYLQDWRIIELRLVPFADWKKRFMLYLNLALKMGESFSICACTCFDEKLPKSFKEYAKGNDPAH